MAAVQRAGDGLCGCGCGESTAPAKKTSRARGTVKGRPVEFLRGHRRRVDRPDYRVVERGCWEWLKWREPNGYGKVHRDGERWAHRWYFKHVGGREVPPGMDLDHLCRNPACVNPDHLEPVTHAENMRRGANVRLGAVAADEVRRLAATGISHSQIATRFAVSKSTVSHAVQGRTWSAA